MNLRCQKKVGPIKRCPTYPSAGVTTNIATATNCVSLYDLRCIQ